MIEFFFDCGSPWTWLASHNIQPLGRELDVGVRCGGFGSPTIFVNGDDMYFGNERLDFVRAAALR